MTDYLYVWHETTFITAEDANAKLDRYLSGDLDAIVPHPHVSAFHAAVLRRFPPLEAFGGDVDDPRSVWSFTPKPSDRVVLAKVRAARVQIGTPGVREIAADLGLICFEPYDMTVWPNVAGYQPTVMLTLETGTVVPDPDRDRLERAVAHLTHEYTPHAPLVLRSPDGRFAQVCFGEHDSDESKTFQMMFGAQDGGLTAATTDIAVATAFMAGFVEARDGWPGEHNWRPA
jgi:hypothetical protein